MKVRQFALIICFCDIWKTFICWGDAVPSWSLVYKLPHLSREEIKKMLASFSDKFNATGMLSINHF